MPLMLTTYQHSELVDIPVLDCQTVETLGQISQLYANPTQQQVAYLVCEQQGIRCAPQMIPWSAVDGLSPKGIFVARNIERNRRRVSGLSDLIGYELWSSSGNKVGEIEDYIFNPETGQIREYLFARKGWRGLYESLHRLRTEAIIHIGTQRILASAQAIQTAEPYPDEWSGKLMRLTNHLSAEYTNTQKHLLRRDYLFQMSDRRFF